MRIKVIKMNDEFIVIDNSIENGNDKIINNAAVIIHMYYEESFERYIDRIIPISKIVDTYFVSSSDELIARIKQIADTNQDVRIQTIKKNNRGRDVSALLVASKHVVDKYKYVCFYHDKASKNEHTKKYVREWEATLFDNSLSNPSFVRRAVSCFESDDKLGALLPPEPIGAYHYFDYWLDNYDKTCELAKDLDLSVVPDRNENPIAIGTVLWFRTDAMRKLFDYGWEYEDFQGEPLPSDGTRSHAIERIFPYVAQDAGYQTKIVVNSDYASKLLTAKKDELEKSTKILEKEFGVLTPRQLNGFYQTLDEIKKLRSDCDKLYIYGTGMFGKACFRLLTRYGIIVEGFVETKKRKEEYEGRKVYEVGEIDKESIVVIAVSELYLEEVENTVKQTGNKWIVVY